MMKPNVVAGHRGQAQLLADSDLDLAAFLVSVATQGKHVHELPPVSQ